jgi:hypothetical protein
MTSDLQGDVSLSWLVKPSGEEVTAREIKEIARPADIMPSAVSARIKRGDVGEYLRRTRGPRGRRSSNQQQPGLSYLTSEITQKAEALGIPLSTLTARVEAGWPDDRLLDPVRRGRRPKRFVSVR